VRESLSIPQTQVDLPPEQPLDPAALAGAQNPEAAEPPRAAAGAPSRTRRAAGPPPIAAPKPTENAAPAGPAAAEVPDRPPLQEIVPAGELKQLQEAASARKREVRQLLERLHGRRLNRHEQGIRANVESFVRLSDEAEAKGDMRQASALAERAWILAKDLESGR
jgi:hypothetical protein